MFSVVIPLYNKESSIHKTLFSVLSQSFCGFEIIVIDDGSNDGSLSVVSMFRDSRIRIFTQNNGGPSAARNRGIKEAKGDYIAFIDADDIWSPDYLREMDMLITEYPDAAIYGFNYAMVEKGITHNPSSVDYRGYVKGWESFPFFFWTSSCCCSKKDLLELGGFDERMYYGEDCDMWYRLLLKGGGAIDTRVFAYYNKDDENSLTRRRMPLEKHIPFFIDKYTEERRNNTEFRRFFDEQMVYRLYPYLFDEQYAKVARALSKKLDYSLLKKSMKFRMRHPYSYRFFRIVKERLLSL